MYSLIQSIFSSFMFREFSANFSKYTLSAKIDFVLALPWFPNVVKMCYIIKFKYHDHDNAVKMSLAENILQCEIYRLM